jgi:hypothetical protein
MEKLKVDSNNFKIICPYCGEETIIQDLEDQVNNMTPGYFEGEIFEGDPLEHCDHCNKSFRVDITVERIKDTLIIKNK